MINSVENKKKEPRVGILVIVRKANKILLGKRLSKVGYGEWGLPGGHLEFRESLVGGARRELLEETGLRAAAMKFINITNDTQAGEHYLHIVFLARRVKGSPLVKEPDKCEAWAWFEKDKLPKPIFYGHKKMLKAVFKRKLFND